MVPSNFEDNIWGILKLLLFYSDYSFSVESKLIFI